MKINNLLVASLVLIFSICTQARQALYLPENTIIDWIEEHGPNEYQIYISGERKIVAKDQISLRAKEPIDGYFFGWVLVENTQTNTFDHCQVNNFFENKVMVAFCDIVLKTDNEQLKSARVWYTGMAEVFMPEIQGPIENFQKKQKVLLTKETLTIKKNKVVKIIAFFNKGKVLVEEPSFRHSFFGGPASKAEYSVVDLADLKEIKKEILNHAQE